MKKYLPVLFLLVLIVPSVVLASWWNPFTWKIFNKKETSTQIKMVENELINNSNLVLDSNAGAENSPINEIEKLKKEIDDLKKQQNVSRIITSKTNTNNVVKEATPIIKESVPVQKISLQIINTDSEVSKNKVVITWGTTVPSESRLIMDNGNGKIYESMTGLSSNHKVEILNLETSKEYNYKITATTENKDGYDDFYDSFVSFMEYNVSFGKIENNCQTIIIKTSAGAIVPNKKIKVSGSYRMINPNILSTRGTITRETDNNGEVTYCEVANTYEITGEGIDVTLSK